MSIEELVRLQREEEIDARDPNDYVLYKNEWIGPIWYSYVKDALKWRPINKPIPSLQLHDLWSIGKDVICIKDIQGDIVYIFADIRLRLEELLPMAFRQYLFEDTIVPRKDELSMSDIYSLLSKYNCLSLDPLSEMTMDYLKETSMRLTFEVMGSDEPPVDPELEYNDFIMDARDENHYLNLWDFHEIPSYCDLSMETVGGRLKKVTRSYGRVEYENIDIKKTHVDDFLYFNEYGFDPKDRFAAYEADLRGEKQEVPVSKTSRYEYSYYETSTSDRCSGGETNSQPHSYSSRKSHQYLPRGTGPPCWLR